MTLSAIAEPQKLSGQADCAPSRARSRFIGVAYSDLLARHRAQQAENPAEYFLEGRHGSVCFWEQRPRAATARAHL